MAAFGTGGKLEADWATVLGLAPVRRIVLAFIVGTL